jgi:cytochrome P450
MSESAAPSESPFLTPEFFRDPYPILAAMRSATPVLHVEALDLSIVLSYSAVREAILDPGRFSSWMGSRAGGHRQSSEAARKIVEDQGYGRGQPGLVNRDEPDHTVYRNLVNQGFRPKRIREMSDYVEQVQTELIDQLPTEDGVVDVVSEFAVPGPLYIISDQLGVPRENYRQFKAWSDAWLIGLGRSITEEEEVDAAKLVVEMQHYLVARANERREKPQEDVLSDLVTGRVDGKPLSDGEFLAIIEQVMVAGNETTTNGIAAGLLILAEQPELHDLLREHPERARDFTEEVLRREAPVQALPRRAVDDVELEGVMIPKDAALMVHFGSANRDPKQFESPDEFDIDRPNKRHHLAFGLGIHHCIGHELARAEMQAAFVAFTKRFRRLELVDDELVYHPTFALRGLESLRLRLVE